METEDERAAGPPPTRRHAVVLGDKGSFTHARCSCGWMGAARRSRWRAFQDGLAHRDAVAE